MQILENKTLIEIAQQLKNANKRVQLIYAFNSTGKTRLSREFKELIASEISDEDKTKKLSRDKILYYNAFTEDLFYWDNDLEKSGSEIEHKLKIQPNTFISWLFEDEGKQNEVTDYFQFCTNKSLTPRFNNAYEIKETKLKVDAFSEVVFSYERGNEESEKNIKISKGEESIFIWSIYYSLISEAIEQLKEKSADNRTTDKFDRLEYVFIDDPVSSLDDNHLIQLAVDLAELIKGAVVKIDSLNFIITTHSPLFFNILNNELRRNERKDEDHKDETLLYKSKHFDSFRLEKKENNEYKLCEQKNDSPFSYHLYLKYELEKAINDGQLQKYHFNFLRNLLEKTSTFLGYEHWEDLLPKKNGKRDAFSNRILNFSSHSKHSSDEMFNITLDDIEDIKKLLKHIDETYKFKKKYND